MLLLHFRKAFELLKYILILTYYLEQVISFYAIAD